MKSLKVIVFGICLILLGHEGFSQGINFQHNLEEAMKLARQENKMIFVDFYTSWCGPCKAMSADIFPQKSVGDFYNDKFINVKIQCDDSGYGVELGKQYKVQAYPTLMYLDANGTTVHSVAGGMDTRGFIELGKTALDPNKNQLVLVKQWDAGNRDQAFMARYFQMLIRSYRGDKAHYDFEKYFESLPKDKKASRNTYDLMKVVNVGPFSPSFEYMEKNTKDFYKSIGKPKIDSAIATAYLWYFKGLQAGGFSSKDGMTEFNAKMKLFKDKKYPFYDEYAEYYAVFDSKGADGKDDINLYMKRGTDFLNKYGKKNDAYAVSLTSMLGNWTGGKDKGAAGIQWMEELFKRNRDPKYLNTYFYILWRNYHWDQALIVGDEIKANLVKEGSSTKTIDDQIKMVTDAKEKYKNRS
ncbi:MAG: thioredoxin family protein [Candidatus Pedobacter colombiensis]|uniref:Thioredoxin family protein n=1 Tax=Candidatus Pedobacter colombiensis TaxID=3121371 RepID=A0AAJ6B7F5_9SPHI|nr:thioredoxin family protein [Pedobacter sp.]WEK20220.1 MAG: thioredoxin family protein [Pedobacter sp.]